METFLELRHLKTLLALEETGSVSLAARRLFLTQSALSHQLRALEAHYRAELFERKSTPLRFSAAGSRLLQLAHEIKPLIENAERDVGQIVAGAAGDLRVAVECHTCFDWLMPAMDAFRPLWPQVELDIVSGFQADPVGLLLSRRADLAIVANDTAQDGIVIHPLFGYEMTGIAAPDHPLAAKAVWLPEDFVDQTLITYPVADEMLDVMEKFLLPQGIRPARRNSELTVAIIQLVASRRGVAVLPSWTVAPYAQKGYVCTAQIGTSPLKSRLFAALRAEDAHLPYLEQFCRIIRDRSFALLPGLEPLEALEAPEG